MQVYPLLLDKKINAFEFDLAEVINVKQQRLDEITNRHSNNIHTIPSLIAGDITDIHTLEDALSRIQNKPAFYIMEGLSYYLSFDNFKAVFSLLKDQMTIGEKIAIDFKIEENIAEQGGAINIHSAFVSFNKSLCF